MSFTLPRERKVLVKPVMWEGWLEPTHCGAWLNDGAIMTITVPIARATGELINPLTAEEKDKISHRGIALRKLQAELKNRFDK